MKSTIVQFVTLLWFSGLPIGIFAGDWSYTGNSTNPYHWVEHHYPACGASYQSPINIVPSQTILDRSLKPIRIFQNSSYNMSEQTYTVINNGHTLKIGFPDNMWYISFANSNQSRYAAVQMHFHWGHNAEKGSEHTLDGKTFAMESHLVAYDSVLYESYTDASRSPYGHTVLGFWSAVSTSADVSQTQFGLMGQFVERIANGLAVEQSVTIEAFDVAALLNQVNPASYYRYEGSLTTPPCTQNVIWTVFTKTIPVLQSQLNLLRKQRCSSTESQETIADNYRPVMALDPEGIPVPRSVFRSKCPSLLANYLLILFSLSGAWWILGC